MIRKLGVRTHVRKRERARKLLHLVCLSRSPDLQNLARFVVALMIDTCDDELALY
jgi:hypothetical protein